MKRILSTFLLITTCLACQKATEVTEEPDIQALRAETKPLIKRIPLKIQP